MSKATALILAPGVRMPCGTYPPSARPTEIIAKAETPVPHRVVSEVFVAWEK